MWSVPVLSYVRGAPAEHGRRHGLISLVGSRVLCRQSWSMSQCNARMPVGGRVRTRFPPWQPRVASLQSPEGMVTPYYRWPLRAMAGSDPGPSLHLKRWLRGPLLLCHGARLTRVHWQDDGEERWRPGWYMRRRTLSIGLLVPLVHDARYWSDSDFRCIRSVGSAYMYT